MHLQNIDSNNNIDLALIKYDYMQQVSFCLISIFYDMCNKMSQSLDHIIFHIIILRDALVIMTCLSSYVSFLGLINYNCTCDLYKVHVNMIFMHSLWSNWLIM